MVGLRRLLPEGVLVKFRTFPYMGMGRGVSQWDLIFSHLLCSLKRPENMEEGSMRENSWQLLQKRHWRDYFFFPAVIPFVEIIPLRHSVGSVCQKE